MSECQKKQQFSSVVARIVQCDHGRPRCSASRQFDEALCRYALADARSAAEAVVGEWRLVGYESRTEHLDMIRLHNNVLTWSLATSPEVLTLTGLQLNMLQIKLDHLLSSATLDLQQSFGHTAVQGLCHRAASNQCCASVRANASGLLSQVLLEYPQRLRLGRCGQERQKHVRG